MFTWKSHAGLKFPFCQKDQYEIHTGLSFISPQFIWTQVKSWLNTKVRLSTEMKFHTGLSSFLLSCERNLSMSAPYEQNVWLKHMRRCVNLVACCWFTFAQFFDSVDVFYAFCPLNIFGFSFCMILYWDKFFQGVIFARATLARFV